MRMTLRSTTAMRSSRQFWDSFVSVSSSSAQCWVTPRTSSCTSGRSIFAASSPVPASSSSSYAGPPFIARCSKKRAMVRSTSAYDSGATPPASIWWRICSAISRDLRRGPAIDFVLLASLRTLGLRLLAARQVGGRRRNDADGHRRLRLLCGLDARVEVRHLDGDHRRVGPAISRLGARALDGLLDVLAGEHAERDGDLALRRQSTDARRRFVDHQLEVRRRAPDDRAQADDAVELARVGDLA